jgi:hypothetical protein
MHTRKGIGKTMAVEGEASCSLLGRSDLNGNRGRSVAGSGGVNRAKNEPKTA